MVAPDGHTEQIEWRRLDHKEISKIPVGAFVLAIRGDGKVYTGMLLEVEMSQAVLGSGNQRQVLQYGNYRYMFAHYQGPPPWTPRLAEKKLV